MKTISKPVMTRTEFEATPEFLSCTPKQHVWLRTLIENGFDYTAATEAAYGCSNPRNARLFGYAVRRQVRIVAALQVYLGTTPREALLEEVLRGLKHTELGSVAHSRLLAQKERLILGGRLKSVVVEDDSDDDEPEKSIPQRIDCGSVAAPATSRVP